MTAILAIVFLGYWIVIAFAAGAIVRFCELGPVIDRLLSKDEPEPAMDDFRTGLLLTIDREELRQRA